MKPHGRFKRGHIPWNKGKTNVYSKEQLEVISKSGKGRIPWNKGKVGLQSHTDEWKIQNSKRMTGENHPNWQGGISFIKYCSKFNNKLKDEIRKRDDYKCQLCKKEQDLNSEKLTVHHIHYDKKNCDPDLITLCRSCNSKVNFNRDYWEQLFNRLLCYKGINIKIYNIESELNIWNYGEFK